MLLLKKRVTFNADLSALGRSDDSLAFDHAFDRSRVTRVFSQTFAKLK